jgi:hypothetical protein
VLKLLIASLGLAAVTLVVIWMFFFRAYTLE